MINQREFNIAAMSEQHVACVLLLDTSGSMEEGGAIDNLNKGVRLFREQSMSDDLAKKRIDVAIIEFNSEATLLQEFVPLANLEVPILRARGTTAMGAGLNMAMDIIEERKAKYRELGTPYFRPWIFLITDGAPTDEKVFGKALARIKELEKKNKVMCWAVGVPGYDKAVLKDITQRVVELVNVNFPSIFEWLSNSMVALSTSAVDKISYPPLPDNAKTIPDDWN